MKNKIKKFYSLFFAIIFSIFIAACNPYSGNIGVISSNTKDQTEETNKVKSTDNDVKLSKTDANGQLEIHYIDVGQGDSILIQQGGKNMLIDTGTTESTDKMMSYLKKLGIKKFDYLILTHPHEDHIGGASAVIKYFDIGTVYMPKVTTTTKVFKNMVDAMNSKGLKALQGKRGINFKFSEADCIILGADNPSGNDYNTYSIVMKLNFGKTSFLFTGDAESSNENEMIKQGLDLSADVLKVSHHGSSTSTSIEFMNKVNPKYAVISVGKGNDYGHPSSSIIKELEKAKIKVYRTDENGTIICTSDGKNITFNQN